MDPHSNDCDRQPLAVMNYINNIKNCSNNNASQSQTQSQTWNWHPFQYDVLGRRTSFILKSTYDRSRKCEIWNCFPSPEKRTSIKSKVREPIWKRRGAQPIPALTLDPMICCDRWLETFPSMVPLLQKVTDHEWVHRNNYLEAHAIEDVREGVVINPPVFPAWYSVEATSKVVPAQLPYCNELLLQKAIKYGYSMDYMIRSMGDVAADYSMALIHPKKRSSHEILILAGKVWQGAAALHAAYRLKFLKMKVSVYIHGEKSGIGMQQEIAFQNLGGTVYRSLNDIKGKKFRVVIVAVEDQYSESKDNSTILPLFGDWLQHSVAVFLDPPILKCSYTTALQVACRGSYNISQKTVIFAPSLPKAYVVDDFIDLYIVDVGIIPEIYTSCGMEPFTFRQNNKSSLAELVIPKKFQVKGSKICFYADADLHDTSF